MKRIVSIIGVLAMATGFRGSEGSDALCAGSESSEVLLNPRTPKLLNKKNAHM